MKKFLLVFLLVCISPISWANIHFNLDQSQINQYGKYDGDYNFIYVYPYGKGGFSGSTENGDARYLSYDIDDVNLAISTAVSTDKSHFPAPTFFVRIPVTSGGTKTCIVNAAILNEFLHSGDLRINLPNDPVYCKR